jgi:hypothetical protein
MMSRLLELIRKRRAELQAQGLEHLGPITDEHRVLAIRRCIAEALYEPAAAQLLRDARAASPEVAAVIDEIEAEMQEEAKARAKKSPEARADDELAWSVRFVTKHRGFIPRER